ncbi:deacetoxyvindoline 4-hydroxylase-like [Mangifera indica]|uniref:deacetoxyvindoline 4-hydroxylase-like n=1 Tax=Mangifera indica TaxID=29780 RepID=UPI001CF9F0FD|nr:deacetoxyvindoline 4-hydroxylase-like [Mangifera indica]
MGTAAHADCGFLTVLLHNQIGGLQVLYENQWMDVAPTPEALVVNIGDLVQIKSISLSHYQQQLKGSRISVASIFRTSSLPEYNWRLYGSIKELVSEENPPLYRQITIPEMIAQFRSKRTAGVSALAPFKL